MVGTSGFDGNDPEQFKEFLREGPKLVKKDLSRPKSGGKSRYELRIGYKNMRGGLGPNVSTSEGTEKIIVWNIPGEKGLQKIIEAFTKLEIDVLMRPYLWFDGAPSVLPSESQI